MQLRLENSFDRLKDNYASKRDSWYIADEPEVTAIELKEKLDKGNGIALLDVREPHEWEISLLEGALLIPQNDLPARLSELDSTDEIVVYCQTGIRSARAVNLLRDAGFRRLKHLRGGINGWARNVDPNMPQY